MFDMANLDFYLISVLIFIGFFAVLIFKDRKNIEIKGILFIRRTKKGKGFLDRIARKSPKFWKIFGSLGVLVCFGGMAFGLYFLLNSLIFPTGAPSLSLVIPFPTNETTVGYGFIGVPFWYFIIGVMTLIFSHEGMHGVLARAEKIKIKNMGLLMLLVIPGAFVEPDEKQLKKADWKTKIRIYAGGSFSNFLLAGLVVLIIFLFISPVLLMEGVGYLGYVNSTKYGAEPYPAQTLNMTSAIISIDGQRIRNVEELSEFMEKTKPGQVVTIETYSENYKVTLAENPDNPNLGFIGLSGVGDTQMIKSEYKGTSFYGIIEFLLEMLGWIWIINIGVGLVNIFPIKPLDGGLMMEALSEKFAPKYKKEIVRFFSAIFLSLIISNFLIGFI